MESSISSKKQTKTHRIVVKTNLFVHFLEENDDPKNHFEIKWPLVLGLSICTFDSDFRKLGQFATSEKSQFLGTLFFSSSPITFYRSPIIFLRGTHYFLQVWKSRCWIKTQCAFEVIKSWVINNMMKQRVFYLLGIHNFVCMKWR